MTYLLVSVLVFLTPLLVAAGILFALLAASTLARLWLEKQPRPAPRLSRPALLPDSPGFQIVGFSARHR